jgi:hypothetical protein
MPSASSASTLHHRVGQALFPTPFLFRRRLAVPTSKLQDANPQWEKEDGQREEEEEKMSGGLVRG